ncbi:type IV pili methyl-accepting chemotaxis transducer N-terminal domain-containing protein [Ideonella sp.]|jgi:two-component system nitrate/nitrite sensor histidine kinase NarX|uniref:type IV pili methyl-accepting chemotaxis transducer N-terminal domain-containing protein n=1 Tax=Ideonella sp. TaxID=1929293 RepID=UPI0037BE668C
MTFPRSLSAKLGTIGTVLLLMALASISLTLWVTWQLEGGAAAVNEAGRMRMQTWRLAQTLSGTDEARVRLYQDQFDSSVRVLATGDPARPLFLPRDVATQAAFADVQQGWQHLQRAWGATPRPSAQVVAQQAEALVERIDVFVTAIEVQLASLTTILNAFQFMMVALALASAVALLYAAYLFVFNPLARLQSGLEKVSKGDLSARVEVSSSDEFGALSQGFNQMATTLQDLYQSLEDKVREKTLRLEQQRARLVAMYEAAAFVAKADSLQTLTQGFARQLQRVADANACAVRWADEHTQRYVLLASEGLPASLTEDEHCLPVGDCHCGQTKQQSQTRVIPIRADGEHGLRSHCERAGFASVLVIPLQLHDRRVGELNLFYRHEHVLSTDDQALLETLASHLAGAIESLRASALEREAAVASERGLLASELHDSIAQSLAFLKIQTGLLRQALKRRDDHQADAVLAELDAGVAESMADVRELLVHFRTRTNTEDISAALQTTLQKFEHQTGLKTHLQLEGAGLPLPADIQVQVLHVVLEALSNVRKHARASTVWVEVQQSLPWRVEVRDDGQGFDTDLATGETHVGLRIMRERAARIGALVELSSVPGSGTCVVLTLPDTQLLAA